MREACLGSQDLKRDYLVSAWRGVVAFCRPLSVPWRTWIVFWAPPRAFKNRSILGTPQKSTTNVSQSDWLGSWPLPMETCCGRCWAPKRNQEGPKIDPESIQNATNRALPLTRSCVSSSCSSCGCQRPTFSIMGQSWIEFVIDVFGGRLCDILGRS